MINNADDYLSLIWSSDRYPILPKNLIDGDILPLRNNGRENIIRAVDGAFIHEAVSTYDTTLAKRKWFNNQTQYEHTRSFGGLARHDINGGLLGTTAYYLDMNLDRGMGGSSVEIYGTIPHSMNRTLYEIPVISGTPNEQLSLSRLTTDYLDPIFGLHTSSGVDSSVFDRGQPVHKEPIQKLYDAYNKMYLFCTYGQLGSGGYITQTESGTTQTGGYMQYYRGESSGFERTFPRDGITLFEANDDEDYLGDILQVFCLWGGYSADYDTYERTYKYGLINAQPYLQISNAPGAKQITVANGFGLYNRIMQTAGWSEGTKKSINFQNTYYVITMERGSRFKWTNWPE